MKHSMITLIALSGLLLLSGCCWVCKSSTAPAEEKEAPAPAAFQIEGTIVYVELEGGFFALEDADGAKYNPVNLPEEFQKDRMNVRVSANPYDGVSVHMYGTLIEIVDITER